MGYYRLPFADAQRFCTDAFCRLGFCAADAAFITDVLLRADLYGIESHGLQRLGRYHRAIMDGTIQVQAKPEIVFETPVSAVLDAHDGMGQSASKLAMELAIQKAKTSGVGMVVMRNSNHYGIAGYYSDMACREGLVGLSMTNTAGIMVPTFGKKAVLGSNPIAVSIPADPVPFCFDSSTTVVTRGKIEVYHKADKPLPVGWGLDSEGLDTTDANVVLHNIIHKSGGGIVPLGGSSEESGSHKGYGLSMLVEIFTGVFALGMTSSQTYTGNKCGVCHSFAAFDPALFGDAAAIRQRLSDYLQEIRESPKATGQQRIYIHGEKEIEASAVRLAEGLPIAEKTLAEMQALCDDVHLNLTDYFNLNG